MRKHSAQIRACGWLLSGLAVLSFTSCSSVSHPEMVSDLPEPATARRAVETALRSWQDDPQIERTTTTTRPIMFVEQQQPPRQKLLRFDILGETPGYEDEGYRRFLVRLSLAEPNDSIVATYYVFGQDHVWVYRSEDFEMIMHMDKSMMPPPPPVVDENLPEQGAGEKVRPTSDDLPPTSKGLTGTVGSD